MKRFLIDAVALAAAATVSEGAIAISVTKTGTFVGFDEYTIRLYGLTGTDGIVNGGPGTVPSVGAISLNVNAGSGVVISTPGTTATWKSKISNAGNGGEASTPPATWVNFDTIVAASRNGPSSATSTSTALNIQGGDLAGVEFRIRPTDADAGTSDDDGFDQTLLAQIYVTAGSAPAIDSNGTYLPPGTNQFSLVGTVATTFANTSAGIVSYVPEPATLGLLGVGGLGLTARRRKA